MNKVMISGESKRWAFPFFTIWSLQALSLLGSMLVQFALIWWLTESTGSATVLATATLVGMVPGIVVGPFSGALVDRWNRRLVMACADGVVALATVGLALIYAMGSMAPWHVYVLMFVRAAAGGFHWAAMTASTSLMVPKEQLSRVAGMNQTLQGAINIVTPPLGALLLTVLPLSGILSIDVVTAILAIVPLFFVRIPQPERTPEQSAAQAGRSVLVDMKEGLQYVAKWPALVAILSVAAVLNALMNPAFSLLPLLVTDHFGGGAIELGWLNSAGGLGVLLGGLILSAWGGFGRKLDTMNLGLVIMTVGVLAIGFVPGNLLWVGIAALFIEGVGNPITNGPFFALLQENVEPSYQGRVFTLVGAITSLMSPLGLAVAGPVADWLGVQSWFIIGGIASVIVAIVIARLPVIRDMEDGIPTQELKVENTQDAAQADGLLPPVAMDGAGD